ncbi:MAG TPA: C4-type zinc ribbon domain-containing protein [Thermoanaerobaculia bacterium]|nr:C4-type zinc ribbon domain-containing protein [Thermoanaerobaculia bacterium]
MERLWDLQTVLSSLAECERQMNEKPESFAAIDREYQAMLDEMKRLEASLEQMGKERRRVEGELNDQQELLRKYQGQLMQVKNQQQYAAAWKEIDATRKHVKELEDSALRILGEIEAVQKQLDEMRSAFEGVKGRWEQAHGAWQDSLAHLKEEAGRLRTRAGELEAVLPDAIRREFQRILKQRQGVAVARVANDSCGSCRTRLRPALFQQLKRGELAHCEGCHRILYLERAG